jgi:anti-sigma factor RsiW
VKQSSSFPKIMAKPSALTEQERADLVAYLDGELGGEAARALEAKLSLEPEARAEAEALRRTWELLDYLPRPEPSTDLTHRTLSRLDPLRVRERKPARLRRRALWGLGWAAAAVLAALGGYAGYQRLVPREPGERELVRDLRVIENKRFYDLVEDLDFLPRLDQPDLFGDEANW